MTQVTITEGYLIVDVQGWDKLWALRRRLRIPLHHVRGVRSAADEKVRGLRVAGTYIPGVIAAGTFRARGEKTFWSVHRRERAIAIDLLDERYSTLIVEVRDPELTMSEIESAVALVTKS